MAAASTSRAPVDLLPVRWRRAATEKDVGKWRVISHKWTGDASVADVRERLAAKKYSPEDEYEKQENLPELYHVDESGAVSKADVDGEKILSWRNTTCTDPLLGEEHPNGKSKAFVLFTFPPFPATAVEAGASRTFGFPRACAPGR
jgi:hypothetical protein